MSVFRVCFAIFPSTLEVEDGDISGLFAPMYRAIMEETKRLANVSLQTADKLGDWDPATEQFDGCLGRIQRNESDSHQPIVDFPILAPGLTHGYVNSASRIMIVSAYEGNVTRNLDNSVTDAFASFEPGVWFTVYAFVTLLSLFFLVARITLIGVQIRSVLQQEREDLVRLLIRRSFQLVQKVLLGNLLKQHSSFHVQVLRSGRLFLLLMTVLTFLLSIFFLSMIKTEAVVQKRPVTMSTYKDILSRPSVQPIWLRALSDHWEFAHADPRSLSGRIWDRAVKSPGGLRRHMIEGTLTELPLIASQIGKQKKVLLLSRYVVSSLVTNGCVMSRSMGFDTNVNSWIHADPSSRERLQGNLLSRSLAPDLVHRIHVSNQRILESGFSAVWLKRLDYIWGKDTGSKNLRDCVANRIILPDHQVIRQDVVYYRPLIVVCVCSAVVAAVILAIELLVTSSPPVPARERSSRRCIKGTTGRAMGPVLVVTTHA